MMTVPEEREWLVVSRYLIRPQSKSYAVPCQFFLYLLSLFFPTFNNSYKSVSLFILHWISPLVDSGVGRVNVVVLHNSIAPLNKKKETRKREKAKNEKNKIKKKRKEKGMKTKHTHKTEMKEKMNEILWGNQERKTKNLKKSWRWR